MSNHIEGKLIVVSNAEPYKHVFDEEEGILCQEVEGGLTTAMNPQMRRTGGVWVAYGRGEADFEVTDPDGEVMVPDSSEVKDEDKYRLKRVDFKNSVYTDFYRGYANKVLWPICHSFPTRADLENEGTYWEEGYLPANRHYARAVLEVYQPGDLIWVHDYHLAALPQLIREELPGAEIGVFWHVPWPPWENFLKIPHDRELLKGLSSADLLGLHIPDYVENFFRCVEKLGGEVDRRGRTCSLGKSSLKVGAYPLGGGFPFFDGAETKEKEQFRSEYGAESIVLGVDRQDYSKCIPERIRGVQRVYPEVSRLPGGGYIDPKDPGKQNRD